MRMRAKLACIINQIMQHIIIRIEIDPNGRVEKTIFKIDQSKSQYNFNHGYG